MSQDLVATLVAAVIAVGTVAAIYRRVKRFDDEIDRRMVEHALEQQRLLDGDPPRTENAPRISAPRRGSPWRATNHVGNQHEGQRRCN